ncbi:MAG: histidinol-phosphate transaminase [Syntrophaceae bacterium]|nr:histidinol-phosphate transaminase [Syntrophaceae bacterium]
MFRKEVIRQEAYPIERISCAVKLDANENPYPLPRAISRKFFKYLQGIPLNRYPLPGAPDVVARFARYYGIGSDMIMAGNGSDELISVLCTALGGEGASVMVPDPTFAMYRIAAANNGHKVISVPLDESFDLDIKSIMDVIERESPSLIFLSYPNNPTGNCFDPAHVDRIIRRSQGLVVVDEAYSHFSGRTFVPDLRQYGNLVVLKTLSKVGLAAMRLGFLLASPKIIYELNKVRLPYNLNTMSQRAALFYLDEEPDFLKQIEKIIREREYLFRKLSNIEGISPYPSETNFIFFGCTYDINIVYNKLIEKGVLVKPFRTEIGGGGHIRATVGTRNENTIFLKALESTVAEVRGVI